MRDSHSDANDGRQGMKRLVPAADTRDPDAGAVGCFVGLPLAIVLSAGVFYLTIQMGLEAGEFTSFLALLGIAASIWVARNVSNGLAGLGRDRALINMDAPTISVSPERVRIGESFTVVYHQDIPKSIVIRELVLQLVRVTTSKRDVMGLKDHYNKDDKIHQIIRRKGREFKPGEIFHREVMFTIPANAPPTTDTSTISEQWLIHVHLYVQGKPDFERDYLLQVEGA